MYYVVFRQDENPDVSLHGKEFLSGFSKGGLPILTDVWSEVLAFSERKEARAALRWFQSMGWNGIVVIM